jgi:hypothetical protein
MVGMGVSDNSAADRSPRVNKEIPRFTKQTLIRQFEEQPDTILSQRVGVECGSLERMKLKRGLR